MTILVDIGAVGGDAMRFATIEYRGERRVAIDHPATPASLGLLPPSYRSVLDVIDIDPLPIDIVDQIDDLAARRLAPIPEPRRNILCVGKNYREHAIEFASSGFDQSDHANSSPEPEHPIVFTKFASSVIGPHDTVELMPHVTTMVDYEAELAVIIGARGRDIAPTDAMRHVWGYTIVNDVTARDRQKTHKQWLLGKTLDTFCPMGPVAVTADELDLADTWVTCYVNGERRQHANTRDLIFSVPDIIATISAGFTLQPGDIIATGTPAGVGIGLDPPQFLQSGDRVTIEVTNIGTLENPFK
jgi:2-keto-4-pentenoate hydratase/2-oxohepta-3-ene-1,7-dioic acid hydratase in catechol pathway